MKVLNVIDHFVGGGASGAIRFLMEYLPCDNAYVFTRETGKVHPEGIEVRTGNGTDLVNYFREGGFDFIHWFRTDNSRLFQEYGATGVRLPILMTLCQVPMSFILRLNLSELRLSDHIVLICQASFNHRYHAFIREKSMVYFCSRHEQIAPKSDYSIRGKVRLGRGSALNKCPKSLLKPLIKLGRAPFEFTVAGGGRSPYRPHWEKQMKRHNLREKVRFVGNLKQEDWYAFLQSLDIFLYTLPADAYSAIDYTLQHAMLTGLPVIYMGPDAPAELIVHGQTGFIARTPAEIARYAVRLIESESLRETMGRRARQHLIENFPHELTVRGYSAVYESFPAAGKKGTPRKIPLTYRLEYALHYGFHLMYASADFIGKFGLLSFIQRILAKFRPRNH